MKVCKLLVCMCIACCMNVLPVGAQQQAQEQVQEQVTEFGNRYEYAADGFSIMFPYGWKVTPINQENVVTAAFSGPDKATGVSANVVVAATRLENKGEDLDSRFSTIMNELSNLGESCVIMNTGAAVINNMPARVIVYTQAMEDYQFLARITVMVQNGIEYRIGSFANPATYEIFKPYFFDIESSFLLISGEKQEEPDQE